MLRKLCSNSVKLGRCRWMSNAGGDGENKGPKVKDVLDDELLTAIDNVASDIHPKNTENKKSLKNTLINRLVANEKSSFDAASASASSEMLDDQALIGLLSDVAGDAKQDQRKVPPKAAQLRQERRGLVLLRKEIFYQAMQSGFTAEEARIKSEQIVNEAQVQLVEQRKALLSGIQEKSAHEQAEELHRNEKEQKLFEMAMDVLEKIYKDDLINSDARKTIQVDKNAPKLFESKNTLGIWKTQEGLKDYSINFWTQWDKRAALLANESFGPTNSFEEQIEWTKKGKQWEYPIDNEFRLGDEQNISFIDHVFLERHLPSLGIPKTGPIAHFMHLVCVGLSKNPYMSASKKREHLQWFANYFNEEKQKLVHKLHEQEQIAAQNAA
ncbi:unnamed protein product [Caenorhabditis angaria]|uniref:Small ribosomal subunit protein mS31 n=1 Tax=Caenorhabditis angaria TaxID=860376 RepID=A0A9P1IKZ1_9PELO|nr:unnamed protein product [Caenorhabditis angaria]